MDGLKWCTLLGLFMSSLVHAKVCDLDYNRYRATVVGECQQAAAQFHNDERPDFHSLVLYPKRTIPDVFWYNDEFQFSTLLQDHTAPLVFNIAGTGAAHHSSKNLAVARALFDQGYHVVNLSSPTYANFIITGLDDKSAMPGYLSRDAEQLYRVMQKVMHYLTEEEDIQADGYSLTGYSLGGAHSAYINALDSQRGHFKFKKVLLINPPYSLYNSVEILDGYLVKANHGRTIGQKIDYLIDRLSDAYSHAERADLSEDTLYALAKEANISNEELRMLIGASFRLSSTDMIFAMDVMYNYGAITWKNTPLTKFDSLTGSLRRGLSLGFLDYFKRGMLPFYRAQEPDITEEGFKARLGLEALSRFIKDADNMYMVTSRDDIILAPGEADKLAGLFGARARLFERGGHCGNMDRQYFVDYLKQVFPAYQAKEGAK